MSWKRAVIGRSAGPRGTHLVVTLGWLPVDHTLDVIDGKVPNLASAPLHKTMAGFDRYKTHVRGHVDLEKLVDILKTPEDVGTPLERLKHALKRGLVLNQLGLTGLKNLTFHGGFEDKYQRRTVVLNVVEPNERLGFLRLVNGGPATFTAGDLPPLPPDVASVRIHHVDWAKTGDTLFGLLKLNDLAKAFHEIPLRGRLLEQLSGLDFDFRKEILPHLDSTLVAYNALSEGPLFLGQVVAIKVKDPAKLRAGMENLNQALIRDLNPKEAPREGFRKKVYRGADFFVWEGRSGRWFPEFFPLSYTIHKGWLVISPFPRR